MPSKKLMSSCNPELMSSCKNYQALARLLIILCVRTNGCVDAHVLVTNCAPTRSLSILNPQESHLKFTI